MFALYSLFINISRGNTHNEVCRYFANKFDMQEDIFNSEFSLLPENEKSIL